MSEKTRNRRTEWNSVAVSLPFRAEELQDATEAFADTIFIDTLKAKQNQIVYGRRGTGKTHLLERLKEEYISKFEEYRSVPIFVNGSHLRQEVNLIIDIPSIIALSLYVEFIKTLVFQLHEFIDSQLDPGFWDKLSFGKQTQTAERAQSIAKELYQLIQKGEVRFLPAGEASDEIQTLNETAAKVSAGASLNLSDPRSLGWKAEWGASAGKETKQSGIELRKMKGQVILPFSQVSAKIQELLTLLGGASLVVLFDEWSDLDRDLNAQPYLADMIKRTFSSITQMHVKLACIPIRTLLATPITIDKPIPLGYEEGDDISADVDLDSIVYIENDMQQFLPFFLVLLKRHMGLYLEWVKLMSMPNFETFVFNEVFNGIDVYSELCQASMGVPRDFLYLFRRSTSKQVAQGQPKIQLFHIRSAALDLYKSKETSFQTGSQELSIVDEIYRNITAKHKTYFFLLSDELVQHPATRLLWAERLIHKMPISYYDMDTHTRYIYYQMDYGKFVDLLSAEAAAKGEKEGRKWATSILDFTPPTWLKIAFSILPLELVPKDKAETILSQLGSSLERLKALMNEPSGSLAPNPKDIIVDKAIFQGKKPRTSRAGRGSKNS
jgi:Cdc6-like AAA superfamily ATPase